jgi:hypothetical protein
MQLSCAVTAVPRDYVQAYFCLSLRGEDAAKGALGARTDSWSGAIDRRVEQHRPSPEVEAALHILEADSR